MFFISSCYLATSFKLQAFIKIKITDMGLQMITVDRNMFPNNKSNKEHH